MATLTYSGNQTSSVGLHSHRTISLSGSSRQNAVATGYITVRLYCSTNAYSKTYEIHASVSGYEGSTSFKFNSSNYGGATISFQIWVGTSFNVNGVSSITVWDATANASQVFIKTTSTLMLTMLRRPRRERLRTSRSGAWLATRTPISGTA